MNAANPTPRDSAQLPPLPEPLVTYRALEDGADHGFTADQMQAYAREALRAQAAAPTADQLAALQELADEGQARGDWNPTQAASAKPVFVVTVTKSGALVEMEPTTEAFNLPSGKYDLYAGAPPAHIPADVEAQAGTVAARFASLLSELERRFPDPEPYSARAPEQRYLASIDAASSPQPQAVAATSPAQAVDAVRVVNEFFNERLAELGSLSPEATEVHAKVRAALQASRQPQPQAQEAAELRMQFNAVIDFAITQGIGAREFLDAWRHGDTSEWPEFAAPK